MTGIQVLVDKYKFTQKRHKFMSTLTWSKTSNGIVHSLNKIFSCKKIKGKQYKKAAKNCFRFAKPSKKETFNDFLFCFISQ
jgi:hypothetical protein